MLYFDASIFDLPYFGMPYTSYESWGEYVLGRESEPFIDEPIQTAQDQASKR